MLWITKLESWGYPKAAELAPILTSLGYNPEAYTNPYELARDLRKLTAQFRATGLEVPKEIVDFFYWLFDQIKKFVTENFPSIALMVGGGIATLFLPKWYKIIGVIPVFAGIYIMLKHYGVI